MTGITEAFCWETGSKEPADYAIRKRDIEKKSHHYSCVSDGCGFPLIPAHWHATGIAWYRSEPFTPIHNHISTCAHRSAFDAEVRAANRETFYRVDTTERYLVPSVLDKLELETFMPWPDHAPPSRQQIAELAAKAPRYKLSGDIEDVANAYVYLKGERTTYPLAVNGNESNYNQAFPYIWDLKRPWNREEWDQHIVRAYCGVSQGKVRDGIWFLNVFAPKDAPPNSLPKISLTVRKESIASDPKKAHLPNFLDEAVGKSVLLFWHEPPPQQRKVGEILGAGRPNNTCFAIREIPKI